MARSVIFLLLIMLASCSPQNSQKVTTIPAERLDGPNGMTIDDDGHLYVASEPGKKVTRIIDGKSEDLLSCDSPDGLDFDLQGNLVISNFNSGAILVNKEGRLDTLVSGLHHPADLKFDKNGNLYISQFDLNNVMMLTTEGNLVLVADSIVNPFGLAVGPDDELFVASNTSGKIYRVANKVKSVFATIPGTISYLAFSEKTRRLYATCFTSHNIYRIDKGGNINVLAGKSRPGYKDGDIGEAEFDSPNSIVLSRDGDLYISEFKSNRIRRISCVE